MNPISADHPSIPAANIGLIGNTCPFDVHTKLNVSLNREALPISTNAIWKETPTLLEVWKIVCR